MIHIDSNNLPASFSLMVNLSPFHPDIMEQLFFILDLGLAWKMLPLTTYCFTGLHMHGGQAPMYKPGPRTDSTPYVRITDINYCPSHFYDNSAALAFIGNAKHNLLNIRMEMRNNALVSYSLNGLLSILMMISLNVLALRGWTGQPNFTAEGGNIMDSRSYLNFFTRNICTITSFAALQAPPEFLLRFDHDALIKAFTMKDENGTRIQADSWAHAPGWSGADSMPGTKYAKGYTDVSDTELIKIFNSDDPDRQTYPFGNEKLDGHVQQEFDTLSRRHANTIGSCVLAEAKRPGDIGGHPATHRSQYLSSIICSS